MGRGRVRTQLRFCCTQASSGFQCSDGVTRVQGKFVAPHWGDGGYPFHLSFPRGHMFSHSTSYVFLQSGLLCLITQKHITNNDCCPYLRNLSALLPICIWPVSSYCSSDFKEREYECSLASRWWAAAESRACLGQVSGPGSHGPPHCQKSPRSKEASLRRESGEHSETMTHHHRDCRQLSRALPLANGTGHLIL